jgi:uncharacterized integral membrane protein
VRRFGGAAAVGVVLVLSMAFAALNGTQRVTLRLGFATLYRTPLVGVVFAAVILGMLVMLAAGIRSDLRVRRVLRERLAEENREERGRIDVDRAQTSLFDEPEEEGS